jgi:hypothetical protein
MKQCPVCKTTYTDESLRYCLADGATLSFTEEPTVLSARKDPLRVDIPERSVNQAVPGVDHKKGTNNWLKATIAFGVILIIFAGAVAVAIAVLYMNTGGRDTSLNKSTPTPTQTVTPDNEKQRLQDELANLQKKIDEQKNSNRGSVNAHPFPTQTEPGVVTARVNSPGDGFLALRNIPDADNGIRLAKIPHGAVVRLNNCDKTKVTISGRSGRWCQVEYAGTTGWVFDAWLDY